MNTKTDSDTPALEPGETVYNHRGQPVGQVTGTTDSGVEVEPLSTDENDSEELPGKEFGEGYLMWRCGECGEMGKIDDGMPSECPNCGAEKEALSEVVED